MSDNIYYHYVLLKPCLVAVYTLYDFSPQVLVGFRAGLWLGSHFLCLLEFALSGLSWCWRVKFVFVSSCLRDACGFCANMDRYLELSIIRSILTGGQVLVEEEQLHSMRLPPTCFTVDTLLFAWQKSCFSLQTFLLRFCSKLIRLRSWYTTAHFATWCGVIEMG